MSIDRIISDEVYEAGENANVPSGTNPFATDAEISGLQTQINGLAPSNAIISGNAAYSGTGLMYNITALQYRIAGVIYNSLATSIALVAADPTFDRIEVLYVDNLGVVGVLAGTPAAAPVKPQVDPNTQVEITFVTVAAGASAPSGLTTIDIYKEDTAPPEWVGSSDFGADFTETVNPHTGTNCINTLTGFIKDKELIFTPAAPYAINGGDLVFWLAPTSSMAAPNKAFRIGFFNAGVLVGTYASLGGVPFIQYGFDPLGPNNVYQLIVIPMTEFGVLPATVDALRIYKPNGGPTQNTTFLLDDVVIIEGTAASSGGATDASAVTYTPTVPGDWGVVPDDVEEALDYLAANAGGGGGNKWKRVFFTWNMVSAGAYTWNGTSVAAPGVGILDQRHRLLAFSGTNNAEEGAYVNFMLPSDYVAGANIKITANLITNVTGGAVYYMGITQPTAGNVLGGSGETEWVPNTLVGVAGYEVLPTVFTFDGTNMSPGDALALLIYRDPNDAADTIAGDTFLHTFLIEQA